MTGQPTEHWGFLNWLGAWFGLRPGSIAEQQLKVATLYYDRIIMPVDTGTFEGIFNAFREEDQLSPQSLKMLRTAWSPVDAYLPPGQMARFKRTLLHLDSDDDVAAPIPLTVRGRVTAADEAICDVLNISRRRLYQIKKEEKYGYFRELNGALASAEGGAHAWLFLQNYAPCALVAFNRIDQVALTGLLRSTPLTEAKTSQPVFDRADHILQPVQMYVPRVGDLPWDVLLRLRRDRRVRAFRRWLCQTSQDNIVPGGDSTCYATDALWDAFGQMRESVSGEIIQGLVGNMPLPIPVNPLGVAIAGKSIFHAIKFERRFGWISFLHKLDKQSRRGNG